MPDRLYKYRNFNTRCLRSITKAEVYYASPNEFNDPMDCDPTIEVDLDRETLEYLLLILLRKTQKKDKSYDHINNLRDISSEYGDYRTDPEVEAYLKNMLARDIKHELDRELGKIGVLSLSATWRSTLMWSHYADEHRGICIEYDTTDQRHPRLGKVKYNMPRAISASDIWKWKSQDDAEAKDWVMQTYFYAKSPEWKYEQEWRDLASNIGPAPVPYRMTAIHFGLRCDIAVITSIVRLLSDRPKVKLWQIRPKGTGFGLRRSLVEREEIEAMGVRDPAWLVFKDVTWPDSEDESED